MSSDSPWYFFLSQNAAGFETSEQDVKNQLGKDAFMISVPYFKLPDIGVPFDDVEHRFPQLEPFKKFLETADDGGNQFWFARVGDGPGNIPIARLTVEKQKDGSWKLVSRFQTYAYRYVGILTREDVEKGKV